MKYTWDDKIRPTLYTRGKKRGTNSADRRKEGQTHVHVCLLSNSNATSRIIFGVKKQSYHETPMSFLFVFSKIWGVYQNISQGNHNKNTAVHKQLLPSKHRWHSVRYTMSSSSSLGASLTSSTCVCSSSSSSSSSHYQPKSYANHHQQRYLPQVR